MNRSMSRKGSSRSYVFCLLVLTWGCAGTIATYDQRAYENATTLKAEVSMLMDKATEPYANHQAAVENLLTRVEAAYEYSSGIPKNAETAGQWERIKDPNRALLGGFMRRWASSSTMLRGDIDAAKTNIMIAFDATIALESAKIRND